MDDETNRRRLQSLADTADRLDTLAETADLMGDDAGADRFHERAWMYRLRAMALLDR